MLCKARVALSSTCCTSRIGNAPDWQMRHICGATQHQTIRHIHASSEVHIDRPRTHAINGVCVVCVVDGVTAVASVSHTSCASMLMFARKYYFVRITRSRAMPCGASLCSNVESCWHLRSTLGGRKISFNKRCAS